MSGPSLGAKADHTMGGRVLLQLPGGPAGDELGLRVARAQGEQDVLLGQLEVGRQHAWRYGSIQV